MVRPIDLQDNLSKTQAAEKMTQIQKSHGEMGQRAVADALKEKTTADLEKTKESEKTDMVIIRKEKEKDDTGQQRKKKKKDERDGSKDNNPDHLDMKI
jgi:hypothetical protein